MLAVRQDLGMEVSRTKSLSFTSIKSKQRQLRAVSSGGGAGHTAGGAGRLSQGPGCAGADSGGCGGVWWAQRSILGSGISMCRDVDI